MKPIRTYAVNVTGYGEAFFSARSPGKALARAYRGYKNICEAITYQDFMKRAKVARIKDPPGCGERIVVNGETVTRCFGIGGQGLGVFYMRDNEDEVLWAAPAEVRREKVA